MLIKSKPTEYFIYPWQTVTVPAGGSAAPAGPPFTKLGVKWAERRLIAPIDLKTSFPNQ